MHPLASKISTMLAFFRSTLKDNLTAHSYQTRRFDKVLNFNFRPLQSGVRCKFVGGSIAKAECPLLQIQHSTLYCPPARSTIAPPYQYTALPVGQKLKSHQPRTWGHSKLVSVFSASSSFMGKTSTDYRS
jgi:hypothetical protein